MSPIHLTANIPMSRESQHRVAAGVAVALALITLAGCAPEPVAEQPVRFEKNRMYAEALARTPGTLADREFMDQALEDAYLVVTALFGTPDEPRIPGFISKDPDFAELLSLQRLEHAAGPFPEPPEPHPAQGLFRMHCAACHSVTGHGRGPSAGLQDPYPRDFRPGVFKWKRTERGSKPTREDLAELIRHGIPGTGMTPFSQLTDEEIDALVDYVIYLAWRGELERTMLSIAAREGFPILTPAPKPDPELEQTDPERYEEQLEAYELYKEQLEYIQDDTFAIAEAWLEAEDNVVEVEIPDAVELVDLSDPASVDQPEVAASIERGREVYLSQVAGCVQCHGKEARGEGQTSDYDDWTKEWTTRTGLTPTLDERALLGLTEDERVLLGLLVRGALPPKPIRPRDFRSGQFRGGAEPEELYRRITQGIEGTPMPAATMSRTPDQPGLQERDVWDLINYVYSLAIEGQSQAAAPAPDAPAPDASV